MKVLFIYPNAQGYGRLPMGPALLATLLLRDGHEVEVFDTTFLLTRTNLDNQTREKAGFVIATDLTGLYTPITGDEVDRRLRARVKAFAPDLVAISIVEDNYEYADHLLGVVKGVAPDLPVIAGGPTPTVGPEVIIENPRIDYLVQGEGEDALREFCRVREAGKPVTGIRNLWSKHDGQRFGNELRPFVKLDTLPDLELGLWDQRHFVKPYVGKLYPTGYFEMSRGCLHHCSYCINDAARQRLRPAGNYHRKKAVGRLIEEVKAQTAKHHYELIFFGDDNFLSRPLPELKEFFSGWLESIRLPYWLNTTIESITVEKLDLLRQSGCCGIGLGLESGSEWIRKNILRRQTGNAAIEQAFRRIHEHGIRTTANNMFGLPGETEEDMVATILLNRTIQPKSCDVTFAAPYLGTPLHRVCVDLHLIETWDQPGFRGMTRHISMRQRPVINNPCVSVERTMEYYYNFMKYVNGESNLPEMGAEVGAAERQRFESIRADIAGRIRQG